VGKAHYRDGCARPHSPHGASTVWTVSLIGGMALFAVGLHVGKIGPADNRGSAICLPTDLAGRMAVVQHTSCAVPVRLVMLVNPCI
jgi:hypothetical protein